MFITNFTELKTDVLIIGSGLGGLLLSLELAGFGLNVVVATKTAIRESNTAYAQGGLAAVIEGNAFDSPGKHLEDTLKCGAGLTDESVARLILQDGAKLIKRLGELQVEFDRKDGGTFDLALEGGHSQPRVLHSKDTTGRSITYALAESALANERITIIESAQAMDLIVGNNRCTGAYFLHEGKHLAIYAHNVALATGGVGQVFSRTTNPCVATGDGIAMAYRANANLADMEFVQFHPTALCKEGAPAFLISEAVRGAGAILLDGQGKRFAKRFHKDGELATRDVVARAINTIMQEQKLDAVGLDLRPIGEERLNSHFPNILKTCRQFGIDPLLEPIPVAPAAHYFMGGILADSYGQTSINNLYALGECAATGLHGANRLASNSLLEAGVMALRVAEHIATQNVPAYPQPAVSLLARRSQAIPSDVGMLRQHMYERAGLLRNEAGLISLLNDLANNAILEVPTSAEQITAANLLVIAKLITRAALTRQESRGAHYRLDYPQADNVRLLKRRVISRSQSHWLPVGTPNKITTVATVS